MKLTGKQKDVLRLLREGVTQSQAVRAVKGVSSSSYYRWKEDPEFRVLIEGAIEEGKQFRKRLRAPATEPVAGLCDETWKEQFLALYVQLGGNVGEAARSAGVRVDDVLELLDKSSEHYDPVFDKAFKRSDGVIDQLVQDRILENIMKGSRGSAADARWWLERRRSDEFGNKSKLELEGPPPAQITAGEVAELLRNLLAPPVTDAEYVQVEPKQLTE